MKKFDEFIQKGIVKLQSPNRSRAESLINEAEDKKRFLELNLKSIPHDKWNANFIANYCYDIIMELIRAKMFLEGFNAGNSHESEISYLEVIGFNTAEITLMDELRYYRNGTKYYGTILTRAYAEKILSFLNKNYNRLKSLIK